MKTILKRHQRGRLRRGLTLIELIVVLVILVALAGILVPSLVGLTTRSHTSSGATNVSELVKALQTHQALYLGYPNNLDSLTTDTTTGEPATYMAEGGADLTTLALTDETLEALNSAGITGVMQMVESDDGEDSGTYAWGPTFYPYAAPIAPATTPLSTTLTDESVLVGLAGTAAARMFGSPAGASYTLLGIGKYSTLSRVMLEAPVHFDDGADGAPTQSYARFVAVFQLTDAANEALEKAKLVGVVAIHDDHVASLSDHLAEYWEANN